MGLFSTKKADPASQVAEHSVIARYRLSPGPGGTATDLTSVYALEDRLIEAIGAARAGEFDGPQFAEDELILCAYGPDADRLFAAMEPALRAFPARPGQVLLRYGGYADTDATEHLVQL